MRNERVEIRSNKEYVPIVFKYRIYMYPLISLFYGLIFFIKVIKRIETEYQLEYIK